METELKILSIIGENGRTVTQRELSTKTSMSLGTINILLKKMIDKGFIKIERLSTRTVRYILTPQGMLEKTKKTYDFIKRTYESILLMKRELEAIVYELPENSTFCLYGEDNEVCQMVDLLLREIAESRSIILKRAKVPEEIKRDSVVIVWESAYEDSLEGHRCVNLLRCLM